MEKIQIDLPESALERFCHKWKVRALFLFGSVLRSDFRSDSDVDVLVTFEDGATPTLFQLVDMEEELQSILGREVDLISRRGVEASRNPYRRRGILNSARLVYEKA